MNKSISQFYRALFANLSTLFCVPGSIFLLFGMLQANRGVLDLAYLNQWEECLIFIGIGIASLVFGLLFLWLHSRETRNNTDIN